jgi:hypothetical protein
LVPHFKKGVVTMIKTEDEKIIQIIPAPQNLYLEYENEDNPKRPITTKAVCLALTDQGEIYLMDIDREGWIDKADSVANFKGIQWNERK